MRVSLFPGLLLFGWMAGCAAQSLPKPVEALDERTGVTVGALKEPIELLPKAQISTFVSTRRTSFAYLGPVEWNRSGVLSYGLWIHIAPGNDGQPGDIHAPGALTLVLNEGPLSLSLIEAPRLGREPYKQVVSWGQTAYFDVSVDTLRRMAASSKLELDVRAADGSLMSFSPEGDTRATLTQYLKDRSITGD
jgi:hypothetical protein